MDKEDVHRSDGILLSHKGKEIGLLVVMWMDLESTVIQRVKSEKRERQISCMKTYVWNLER